MSIQGRPLKFLSRLAGVLDRMPSAKVFKFQLYLSGAASGFDMLPVYDRVQRTVKRNREAFFDVTGSYHVFSPLRNGHSIYIDGRIIRFSR
jgi:hypothetical protein